MGGLKLRTIIRKELPQIFFVILSFVLMVAVSYYFVSRIAENRLFANGQETINTAEIYIHSCLREAEANLLQAERLIENWLDFGETPDKINSRLAALTWKLSSESAWAQSTMNIYGIINETFMTGIYPLPPPGDQYDSSWYQAAKAAKGGIGISGPYNDQDTGRPVISLSKMIYDKNGTQYGTLVLTLIFRPFPST